MQMVLICGQRTRRALGGPLILVIGGVYLLGVTSVVRSEDEQVAPTVPDVISAGRFAVDEFMYGAAPFSVTANRRGSDGKPSGPTYKHRLEGMVYRPLNKTGPSPVIFWMHYGHATCSHANGIDDFGPPFPCLDDGTRGTTELRSFMGYAYLGRYFASHGYVFISINANDAYGRTSKRVNNFTETPGHGRTGVDQRLEVLKETMLLFNIASQGASRLSAKSLNGSAVGLTLTGELDMGSVGVGGHSYGGETASAWPEFMADKALEGKRWLTRAVLNVGGGAGLLMRPRNVPYGVVVTSCDSDSSPRLDQELFESGQYEAPLPGPALGGLPMGLQPRHLFMYHGGSHGEVNSAGYTNEAVRSLKDFNNGVGDRACDLRMPDNILVSAEDQRRMLTYFAGAFFRYYLGHENGMFPIIRGETPLQATAYPHSGVIPGEEFSDVSYFPAPRDRRDLLRPEPDDDLSRTHEGAALSLRGFQLASTCNPSGEKELTGLFYDYAPVKECMGDFWREFPKYKNAKPIYGSDTAFGSGGPQIQLRWDKPGGVVNIALAGSEQSIVDWKYLALAGGVDITDGRNPVRVSSLPSSARQDFRVGLVDSAGRSQYFPVSKFSPLALQVPESALRSYWAATTLRTILIPLSAFTDVDRSEIVEIRLLFDVTNRGAIDLADVRFEK